MDQAIAFGARPSNTNSLPTIQAEWHYKRDADGVQLYLTGDYLSQVESFLLTAFGPPALVKTRADGAVSGGVYAAPVIGAAIQFGRDDSGGMSLTEIVITRKEAFNP